MRERPHGRNWLNPSNWRDRFTPIFGVVLFGLVALVAALRELSYADRDVVTFPLELVLVIWGLAATAGLTIFLSVDRKWRLAASAAMAPILVYILCKAFIAVGVTPTTVRFSLVKPWYDDQIRSAANQGARRPLLLSFPWGEFGGAAVTNIFGTLIYDESDEIAKPVKERSSAWLWRPEVQAGNRLSAFANVNPNDPPRRLQHLGGHFYLMTEIY